MSNAVKCINKRSAVKSSGSSCLALIFNLSNPRTTILHGEKLFRVDDESYTVFFRISIRIYGSVVNVSRSVLGGIGSIPSGC